MATPEPSSTPFKIDVDLTELSELNQVLQDRSTGLFKSGKPFAKDPRRQHAILTIVQRLFQPLGQEVVIRLGTGESSDRFLKADFSFNGEPEVGGVSAKGLSRSTTGKFQKKGRDEGLKVTGYIFEGVIGDWIGKYLDGNGNISSIFAGFIAHELGHQLGLSHSESPRDLMYVFQGGSAKERTIYMENLSKGNSNFSKEQIKVMQDTLAQP